VSLFTREIGIDRKFTGRFWVNPRAVIDVGSHSVLLLVAEETEKGLRVLLEDYRISALGTASGSFWRITAFPPWAPDWDKPA
jgi:hypothetical protein